MNNKMGRHPMYLRMLIDLNTTTSNNTYSGATMTFICLRLNTCCFVIFPHRLHYLDNPNTKYSSTNPNTWIFPTTFHLRYSVVKTQSSIEFQNSFFHPFNFNNSNFNAIVEVLFLIHYPHRQTLERWYIFSVFYSESTFSSNLPGFKSQSFYSLSRVTMETLWVTLTKINSNHKTQSSMQARW